MRYDKFLITVNFVIIIIAIWIGISWVINFFKFLRCDFAEPWKDEIIYGVGVFGILPSLITAWL